MGPENLHTEVNEVDYERAVSSFYEPLYEFAYSLSGNENDACELTQEAFARLVAKQSVNNAIRSEEERSGQQKTAKRD